jgi:hypothetical protein
MNAAWGFYGRNAERAEIERILLSRRYFFGPYTCVDGSRLAREIDVDRRQSLAVMRPACWCGSDDRWPRWYPLVEASSQNRELSPCV